MQVIAGIILNPSLPGESLLKPSKIILQRLSLAISAFREPFKEVSPSSRNLSPLIKISRIAHNSVRVIYWLALSILGITLTLPLSITGSILKINSIRSNPIALPSQSSQEFSAVNGELPSQILLKIKPPALIVEEVKPGIPLQPLAVVVRRWHADAETKSKMAKKEKEADIFDDSKRMLDKIAECLEYPKECKNVYKEITLCRDSVTQQYEAIALTKQHTLESRLKGNLGKYLKVVYLATNPKNISAENNDENQRVKGAGRAIISHLAQLCLEKQCKGLYLESEFLAVGFYRKQGFRYISDEDDLITENKNTVPLWLSTKKIKNMQSPAFRPQTL